MLSFEDRYRYQLFYYLSPILLIFLNNIERSQELHLCLQYYHLMILLHLFCYFVN